MDYPRYMASEEIGRADEALVARSRAMKNILALAERVARTDTPVLLTGESGSGKERVARTIHARSRRARGAFIPVNCGALPEHLLESELFGHVRGAFTGADRDHRGLFEAASGGTLLLDEVGEIPLGLQVKLLRVLQDHEVRRVGSTESRRIDVRVIAATNRDLDAMVRERAFRKDVYYRLKVVSIEVPPLRERREDILPLAHAFMRRSCTAYHCGPCSLSAEALDRLLAYDWPGNVRELEHAMERAVVLARASRRSPRPTCRRRSRARRAARPTTASSCRWPRLSGGTSCASFRFWRATARRRRASSASERTRSGASYALTRQPGPTAGRWHRHHSRRRTSGANRSGELAVPRQNPSAN